MSEPDTEMINNMTEPAPAPEVEAPKYPDTVKVKINGEEKEIPFDQAIQHAQKHMAGEDKLREAAEIQRKHQELNDLVSRAYNKENPDMDAVATLMRTTGYSEREIAETLSYFEDTPEEEPTTVRDEQPTPNHTDNSEEINTVKQMIWQERLDTFIDTTQQALKSNPVIKDIEDSIAKLEDKELQASWNEIREETLNRLIEKRVSEIDDDRWSIAGMRTLANDIAAAVAARGSKLRLTSSTLGRGTRTPEAATPQIEIPKKPKPTGDKRKDRDAAQDYITKRLKAHTQELSSSPEYQKGYHGLFGGH